MFSVSNVPLVKTTVAPCARASDTRAAITGSDSTFDLACDASPSMTLASVSTSATAVPTIPTTMPGGGIRDSRGFGERHARRRPPS